MQDRDPTGAVDRVVQRPQDLAVRVRRIDVGEVLRHGLARHREAVTVQQSRIQQRLHHHGHATDPVHIVHDVASEWLEVAQVRDAGGYAVEVGQREVDLGLMCDREQVQHRVGGAAEGHHHGDGVLERLLRHDLTGRNASAKQLDHGLARLVGEVVPPAIGRRRGCRSRKRHPHCFRNRGHRVRGVHPAAGAFARADGPLNPVQITLAHQPALAGAHRLEGVNQRDFLLRAVLELDPARHDRAGVEEDRGEVEACRRHQHAWKRLIAPGQQHRSIQAFGRHHGLNGVSNDVSRDQREVHSLVTHRDPVGNRDGAEFHRVSPAGVHALLDRLGQTVKGEVARGDLVPRARDADLGLDPVVIAHPDGAQHPARGGGLNPVSHLP